MTDTDKIDLSLQANQNKIAVSLSTFFSVDELEAIEFKNLRCPYDQIATHPCGCMEYSKEFEDGKQFQIHCIIDTNCVPNVHFTSIRIKNGDLYQSDFKCNPNSKNADYMTLIIKRAINYNKYKYFEDTNYNKQNIIRNFSNKMIHDLGNNTSIYEAFKKKFMEVEKKCDELNGIVEGSVIIECETETAKAKAFTVDDNIFKFEYVNIKTGISDFCYFLRGHIGLDMLILVFDRSLNKIKIDSLDNGVF